MRQYRIMLPVETASGFQFFLVNATSEEDAIRRHKAGESEYESEEVSVESVGPPECEPADEPGDQAMSDNSPRCDVCGAVAFQRYADNGQPPWRCNDCCFAKDKPIDIQRLSPAIEGMIITLRPDERGRYVLYEDAVDHIKKSFERGYSACRP